MTREWRVLLDHVRSAAAHMARDVALANEGVATVRFFRWEPPAISTGWKQPLPAWLHTVPWDRAGLEVVERPTGGGIAFHGSDVSVSVVVPRMLNVPVATLLHAVCESAARLCETYGVKATVVGNMASSTRITYCLTEVSPYAVVLKSDPTTLERVTRGQGPHPPGADDADSACLPSPDGDRQAARRGRVGWHRGRTRFDGGGRDSHRKVAGFALRRYPESWLIQGSLLVRPIPDVMNGAIPGDVLERLRRRAVPLAEAAHESLTEWAVAQRWAAHWSAWWDECETPLVTAKSQKSAKTQRDVRRDLFALLRDFAPLR